MRTLRLTNTDLIFVGVSLFWGDGAFVVGGWSEAGLVKPKVFKKDLGFQVLIRAVETHFKKPRFF